MPRNPDRTNLCHFTYADGRRCTVPQFPDDLGFCFFHRQNYQEHLQSKEAGRIVSRFLHTNVITASDVTCTIAALFDATAQGYIKPKTAATLGYLVQLMLQAQQLAKKEFTDTFKKPWEDVVSKTCAFTEDDADIAAAAESVEPFTMPDRGPIPSPTIDSGAPPSPTPASSEPDSVPTYSASADSKLRPANFEPTFPDLVSSSDDEPHPTSFSRCN